MASQKVSVVRTTELGASEIQRWREIQWANDSLSDPFFNPEWAWIVGSERADARTAIVEEGGKIVAFVSIQRCDCFTGMGLGSPVTDYDGFIALPNVAIDYAQFPRAFGVDRIDFNHMPLEIPQNEAIIRVKETVMLSSIDKWETFRAGLTNKSSSNFRNMERYRRKMATEKGELSFSSYNKNSQALDRLFAWKSGQYVATGHPNIIERSWIREVHRKVHDFESEEFGGVMFTLRAGEQLAAAMLALRNKTRLHAWMIAYNNEFARYSPGILIWFEMMNRARENGITHIDFGGGLYDYKKFFANEEREVGGGFIGRPSVSTLIRRAMFGVRDWAERRSNEHLRAIPGKAMRKLDLLRGTMGRVSNS